MIKESGAKILEALVEDGILSREGPMYFLDPIQLSAQLNLSYVEAAANEFDQAAVAFVERTLQ